MHVGATTTRIHGSHLELSAVFTSHSGAFEPTDVLFRVDRSLAGRVDTSLTPFVPVAVLMAALVGEDLHLDGPVDGSVLAGTLQVTRHRTRWWEWTVPQVQAPDAATIPASAPAADRGHGLFFSRGLDSWASLLMMLDDQAERAPTHLLWIDGIDRSRPRELQQQVGREIHAIAAEVGLPCIEVFTSARDLVDTTGRDWLHTYGAVLASVALLLAPALGRVSIASGAGPDTDRPSGTFRDTDHLWGGDRLELVHHLVMQREQKAAIVARSDLALRTLLVCFDSGTTRNCGRCPKCLRTMACLRWAGALHRCPAFDAPLTPEAVARTPGLFPYNAAQHLEYLDADDEYRWAFRHSLLGPLDRLRLVAPTEHGPAGPSLQHRVNLGFEGTAIVADTRPRPSDDPDDPAPADLAVGWEPGMAPLRPPVRAVRRIRAVVATHPHRTVPWVVAQPADPSAVGEVGPAGLADAAEAAWGPGLCHLSGIGWGLHQLPTLAPRSVGRMLRSARIRLWWAPDGTLDPLLLLESLEHGCLPLQVMPAEAAARLRPRLPAALQPLVVAVDHLTLVDPAHTEPLLAAACDLVTTGDPTRDLTGVAARWPTHHLTSDHA